jgi:chromosomal replication initiator protein
MGLDPRQSFSSFVVGNANRLAVAAARAVAEAPGRVYNPLVVYGGSGLGKTHLLAAISARAQELRPALLASYVTVFDFVEQFHAAVAAGRTAAWTARWQAVDLLLVDDIQFLTGRHETQAELLRLFTAMQSRERQVVLTSDRPPSEIADVDARLIARLQGGLVVDVGRPDFETRAAILRGLAAQRGFDVPDAMLDELAHYLFTNVRELQGALTRLAAQRALGDGRVSVAEIARALGVAPPGDARAAGDDFASFVDEVGAVLEAQVDSWRMRLGEAVAHWGAAGYRTAVLERAAALPTPPDVDGLLATFTQAVEHLRQLEARAIELDPALGGDAVFRDPERLAEAEELVERALAGAHPPPGPSPLYQRADLLVSPANQLALRAADAVIAEPGARFNPLLVHGAAGAGKTHLVHAIGNALAARPGPALVVACVRSAQFIDELIAAIGAGTVERWRARYRAVDVLIVEDMQGLAGKERSQEEFFHLFNALLAAGKQVVLTSDVAPHRIPGLEARVRSRLEGGLVVPLGAPDAALREALVRRLLLPAVPAPEPALVQLLAGEDGTLPGALRQRVQQLLTAAEAAAGPVTLGLARRVLGLGEEGVVGARG